MQKRKARRISETETAAILAMARAGKLYREIGAVFDRDPSVIHGVCERHGISRVAKKAVKLRRCRPVLALPVAPDGYIAAPTRARLMAGR